MSEGGSRPASIASALLRAAVLAFHGLILLGALAVPASVVLAAALEMRAGEGSAAAILADLPRWLALLGNTLIVTGAAVVVAVILGTALALLATRTDLPGRRALLSVLLLGACVPVYLMAVLFLPELPASRWLGSAAMCGLLYGVALTPLAALVIGLALQAGDRELEDQVRLEGGWWSVLRWALLPQAAWGIATAAALVLLLVATDYSLTDLLIVRTFAEEVYTQYALGSGRAGPLLTAVPLMFGLALLLLFVQARFRVLGEGSPAAAGARPEPLKLGRARWAAAGLVFVVLAVGCGLPLRSLIMQALPVDEGLGRTVLNLRWSLWSSCWLAAVGATLTVPPALGLAWGATRGGWSRGAIWAAVIVLLSVPAPVVGLGLIELLNRPALPAWLYDSVLPVVAGYVVRFLPFAIVLLTPAARRIARELEQAARADGAGWLATHRHVRVPLMLPDAVLVWLVVFVLCFGELGATKLVVPPAVDLVSVVIFSLMHGGVYRDLAVLTLLALVSMLLPWSLLAVALRWRTRRAEPESEPESEPPARAGGQVPRSEPPARAGGQTESSVPRTKDPR